MKKFQNKYPTESTRLEDWDYSNPGMYFVTICSKNMVSWFGEVLDGETVLNEMGGIANKCWIEIPNHFENVKMDEYIIMPNHVHGIVELLGDHTVGRDVACNVSTSDRMSHISPKPGSLSAIIRSYKSAITRIIRKYHNPKFAWQPHFWDHVIRNENSLERIQNYIQNNPVNWNQNQNIKTEDNRFFNSL